MSKEYLLKPLAFLWLAIILIRTSLDQLLLHRPDASSLLDFLTAGFVLPVPLIEALIIYRAYKAYSTCATPIQAYSSGIAGKILFPVIFFCLPFGLWDSRRFVVDFPDGRWIDILGTAAGCGINLVLSGAFVHSILATHLRVRVNDGKL